MNSSNDILILENSFGMNFLADVNFIFSSSTTPLQPNARGVDVRGNTMKRRSRRGMPRH